MRPVAPVTDQIDTVHAAVVGHAQTLHRATMTLFERRGAGVGHLVRILGHGQYTDRRALVVGTGQRMAVRTLHAVPTEVLAAATVGRRPMHLLPVVLADVGDEQGAGLGVERELVGVAQAVLPDLRARARLDLGEVQLGDAEQLHQPLVVGTGQRIGGRNEIRDPVVLLGVDVDAQHLAEQHAQVLTGFVRVAFPTAITRADIQISVGSELDLTAIVVVVRLLDAQQHLGGLVGALGGHQVGARRVDLKAHDRAIAVERQ
jgi:hypothetical protein